MAEWQTSAQYTVRQSHPPIHQAAHMNANIMLPSLLLHSPTHSKHQSIILAVPTVLFPETIQNSTAEFFGTYRVKQNITSWGDKSQRIIY
jgi:hypothetical protein